MRRPLPVFAPACLLLTRPVCVVFPLPRSYYDAASSREAPRWSAVDVAFEAKLGTPVTLAQLRAAAAAGDAAIAGMELLTRPRLSVQRVSAEAWDAVLRLAGGTA